MKWKNIINELPTKTSWYLVYAPSYSGGSSSGLACHDGIMFSQFIVAKNGNTSWSVEKACWNKNCVKYWMELPEVTDDMTNLQNKKETFENPNQLTFDFI